MRAISRSVSIEVSKATGEGRSRGKPKAEPRTRSKVHPTPTPSPFRKIAYTTVDLREVLRLQSSDAEALAEIIALCSTERSATEVQDEPAASCSSSSAAPSPFTFTFTASPTHSSWIPTPEPPPPLPFPRIKTDDRKLKICFLPITIDIPADFPEAAASTMEPGTVVNHQLN